MTKSRIWLDVAVLAAAIVLVLGIALRAVVLPVVATAFSLLVAGLVMVAAVIPFAHTDLINVRQFGVGVCVAILLEVLVVRPVLLPAAEAVLGRFGWWPTAGPSAAGPAGPEARKRVTRRRVRHMPLAHPPRP